MISDILNELKPCSWKWNDTGKTSFGFIAQDLLEIFPEDEYDIVEKEPDGYYAVKYHQLIPFLVQKIKNQEERIQKLESLLSNEQSN